MRRAIAVLGAAGLLAAASACAQRASTTPASPQRVALAGPNGSSRHMSSQDVLPTGPDRELRRFRTRAAMRHVGRLAGGIGPRVRGTPPERRAARYIARKFRDLGYNVSIQRFTVDGDRTSRNVVAWWPGAARYPLVVGAHMDTVSGSPGANDNASGVAVMLENARAVAAREQSRWIKFVAFGSEEYGSNGEHHIGSYVYVRRLGDHGRRRLAGMVSVDMVADGRPLIVGTAGIGPQRVARTLYRKLERAYVGAIDYRTLCDCSDNGPFERAGIPGAMMWSGDEPDYHSPSDTVANMSRRDLRRTGRGLRIFLREIDRGMIRYFRRS